MTMEKQKPRTAREVLDIIDEFFTSGSFTEGHKLSAVLTALRGPDVVSNEYRSRLKLHTTCVVRSIALPKTHAVSKKCAGCCTARMVFYYGDMGEAWKAIHDILALGTWHYLDTREVGSLGPQHFRDHIDEAVWALDSMREEKEYEDSQTEKERSQ